MSLIEKFLGPQQAATEARQDTLDRIHLNPGIPDAKRTSEPFWLKDPHPQIANAQSNSLLEQADIVIIGSGITGTSIAYNIFEHSNHVPSSPSASTAKENSMPSVVMLEARSACSGATGRNGGHILEIVDEYDDLKSSYGQEAAMKLTRFRLAQRGALIELADKLGLREESQIRKVRFVNAFFEEEGFGEACEALEEFRKDMPVEAGDFVAYSKEEAREKFLIPQTVGAICGPAGAVWPYKLITGVLAKLKSDFPNAFHLETNTPVTEIIEDANSHPSHPFKILTPRGIIRAKHIIHSSNGHVGHLVPGLIGRVFPVRGQMSAQPPGQNFPSLGSKYSWLINYEHGYDYLTQLPSNGTTSNGEMMLGGGLAQTRNRGLEEIGVATDFGTNIYADIHLSGALSAVFGRENWGAVEGKSVISIWTGTMGFSSDGFPWVGKLSASLTRRPLGNESGSEWVAAAFGGEGMVHCWLSGKALAIMILNYDGKLKEGVSGDISTWFPEQLLVTEERVAETLMPRTIEEFE